MDEEKKEPSTPQVKDSNQSDVKILKSVFKSKSANQLIEDAKKEPMPKKLVGDLIYEHEQPTTFNTSFEQDKGTEKGNEKPVIQIDNETHNHNRVNHFDVWKEDITTRIKKSSKSQKQEFTFQEALKRKSYFTQRDKSYLEAFDFLQRNPLRDNDYSKFVNYYIKTGKKLSHKYFCNSREKLNKYYKKVDSSKANSLYYNPFNNSAYETYVLFMVLKLRGQCTSEDDQRFKVIAKGSREYNPLTNIPSVLRGELPFEVKEYDIIRAFPTFIDFEVGGNYRKTVYEKLNKKEYSMLLNSNSSNPKLKIEDVRTALSVVYGKDTNKVLTEERFNNKGQVHLDLSSHEKKYIEKFIQKNQPKNYVRLYDGIFVLKETTCKVLKFETVEFSIKECIKPHIENKTINFYDIDGYGRVITSRTMYADFFIQEKFKRLSTPDDKIQLLVDSNNVIDYFNHKTNIVSFLEKNINEDFALAQAVRERIARECTSTIYQSFALIPPTDLIYYSDSKEGFGLPFKNGFHFFDPSTNGDIKCKDYTEVEGMFSPHKIQSREFKYTDEKGMFEFFLMRAAIGKIEVENENGEHIFTTFKSMLGYLCQTNKSQINAPCIVFSDTNANDENRNGGRGKSLVAKAISEVQTQLFKGGLEFDPTYQFVFDDLERKHKSYIIDDVPAGFNYDHLYTNILSPINCHRKGRKAESIPFEESPKFVITTNWVIRYDEKNASTNRRFLEFKFSDYYHMNHSPKDEFGSVFFEDWDVDEWNRFYSFIFRCVKLFHKNGLSQIPYDKADDNYRVYFNSDVLLQEFERIIFQLTHNKLSFNVSDFLKIYLQGELRFEKLFTTRNTKKYIDAWFSKTNNEGWSYNQRDRTWEYKSINQA